MSDGNVRVAVRVRPMCAKERLAGANEVISLGSGATVLAPPDRCFTFDATHDAAATQEELFDELARPLVEKCLEGFNCTILAYGQTGSGKTFTMGTGLDSNVDPATQGIVPRAVSHLVDRLQSLFSPSGERHGDGQFFEVYVSFLELYNEEIVDLLNMQSTDRAVDRSKRPVLTIREDSSGAICIAGIREEKVASIDDIMECLRRGSLCRTTKSTDMNSVSSRSHAVFTVILRQRRPSSEDQDQDQTLKSLVSKLHFVDLAGSERMKRTNAIGDRAKESISINSGLLALGNVISALGDDSKRSTHIPYRDSKLTRLLQDSLGGNSHTVMIACVSPSSDNYSETVNTLKYANRARNIKNRAQINEDGPGNAAFEIMQLRKTVAALKQEILQLRGLGLRRGADSTAPRADRRSTGPDSSEELARLRLHNRELQKKIESVTKEKIQIEAERDFYKTTHTSQKSGPGGGAAAGSGGSPRQAQISVIRDHLKTISELRSRISDLEVQLRHTDSEGAKGRGARRTLAQNHTAAVGSSQGPSSGRAAAAAPNLEAPTTPGWFSKANALIEKTREELRSNISVMTEMKSSVPAEGLDDDKVYPTAVSASRTEALMEQIQNDICLKEELIVQLDNSKQEFLCMRQKYEERLRLLHENILSVQRERDEALKAVAPPDDLRKLTRIKYEEKIKKMGKEIVDLRERIADLNRDSGTRAAANDILVRNLRATLQTLKTERTKLQAKLDETMNKLRSNYGGQDAEMRELRQRERKSAEQARKYKKAYDFQKTLLQKRIEQYMQTKHRVRSLVAALRKHKVPFSPSITNLLESPGYRNIPKKSTHSHPATADAFLETPTGYRSRESSGLASKCTSAADLRAENSEALAEKYEQLSLGARPAKLELGSMEGLGYTDDADPDLDSAILTPVEFSIRTPTKSHGSASPSRRGSLVGRGQPLIAPAGSEVPRSVLRMSPLIPKRKDMFARLADAASLSLASHHIRQIQSWSSGSLSTPPSPSTPHLSSSPSKSPSNDADMVTSPMKIEEDLVEFYRSNVD